MIYYVMNVQVLNCHQINIPDILETPLCHTCETEIYKKCRKCREYCIPKDSKVKKCYNCKYYSDCSICHHTNILKESNDNVCYQCKEKYKTCAICFKLKIRKNSNENICYSCKRYCPGCSHNNNIKRLGGTYLCEQCNTEKLLIRNWFDS